jgi:hypothetical protein
METKNQKRKNTSRKAEKKLHKKPKLKKPETCIQKTKKKKKIKTEVFKPSRRGCATDRCLINAEIYRSQSSNQKQSMRERRRRAKRFEAKAFALHCTGQARSPFALHKAGSPVTAIITIRLPMLVTAVNGGQSTIRLS